MSSVFPAYVVLGTIGLLDILWIINYRKGSTSIKKRGTRILAGRNVGGAVTYLIIGNFLGGFAIVIWFGVKGLLRLPLLILLLLGSYRLLYLSFYYLARKVVISQEGVYLRGISNKEFYYTYSEIKRIHIRTGGVVIVVPGHRIYLDKECKWIVLRKYLLNDWDSLTYKRRIIDFFPDGRLKDALERFNIILDIRWEWATLSVVLLIIPVFLLIRGQNTIIPYNELVFEKVTITEAKTVFERTKYWPIYIYTNDQRVFIIEDYYLSSIEYFSAMDRTGFIDSISGNDEAVIGYVENQKNKRLEVYEIRKGGIDYLTYSDCVRVNSHQNQLGRGVILLGIGLSIVVFMAKVVNKDKL